MFFFHWYLLKKTSWQALTEHFQTEQGSPGWGGKGKCNAFFLVFLLLQSQRVDYWCFLSIYNSPKQDYKSQYHKLFFAKKTFKCNIAFQRQLMYSHGNKSVLLKLLPVIQRLQIVVGVLKSKKALAIKSLCCSAQLVCHWLFLRDL